ncbi:unnamed protein product [Soboliphyme baturini]|uniref:RNase_PH domain-containing protein n=1 Tax=Soboliphyme baturini TaxID=241478 RepID=A0A183IWU1_9BILA|nr:unnamed protein product [Soboliphyme baturini]
MRLGTFSVNEALLPKHWNLQNILENIALCRMLLSRASLQPSPVLRRAPAHECLMIDTIAPDDYNPVGCTGSEATVNHGLGDSGLIQSFILGISLEPVINASWAVGFLASIYFPDGKMMQRTDVHLPADLHNENDSADQMASEAGDMTLRVISGNSEKTLLIESDSRDVGLERNVLLLRKSLPVDFTTISDVSDIDISQFCEALRTRCIDLLRKAVILPSSQTFTLLSAAFAARSDRPHCRRTVPRLAI